MAHAVGTLPQRVADADSLIKDEALSPPQAVALRHLFKVFQDAALQVKDLWHALLQQEVRRFLTPDAAGAEHRHALVSEPPRIRAPPGRELAKAARPRIDRAFKRADGDLVIVAGVDDDDIGGGDQCVPVARRDVMSGPGARVDFGFSHRNDLALQAHLHAAEGHVRGGAFFPVEIAAAGQGADMIKRLVDPGARPRDGAVDPLPSQQQRPPNPHGVAGRQKWRPERGGVVEGGEFVKCCHGEHRPPIDPGPSPHKRGQEFPASCRAQGVVECRRTIAPQGSFSNPSKDFRDADPQGPAGH